MSTDRYLEHESDPSAIYAGWDSEMPNDEEPELVERTARTGCSVVDLMEALRESFAREQADAAWKDLGPDAPLSAAPTLTELLGD